MPYKIFEYFSFVALFLSFTSVTYSRPWTSMTMELFAFSSIIFAYFSIPLKNHFFSSNTFSLTGIAFIVISGISFLLIKPRFIEHTYFFVLYIATAIVFCNVLMQKDNDYRRKYISTLVFCSLFTAFSILLQQFDIQYPYLSLWVAEYDASHGRPYANFGQPNLAATLLLTGLCGTLFLQKKKELGKTSTYLTSLLLGAALAYPASKTSMLSLLLLIALSIFFKSRRSFTAFTLCALSLAVTKLLSQSTRNFVSTDIATGRFEVWQTILTAISQAPWVGYGTFNTHAAHFAVRELNLTPKGQFLDSAHNLLLDLVVWFGIPLGVIACALFLKILFDFLKNNKEKKEVLFLAIPIVTHSQLELPLFYLNFIALFTFIITFNQKTIKNIKSLLLPFAIITTTITMMFFIAKDYASLEREFSNYRYFEKGFIKAEKPEPITPTVLDKTFNQYNFFVSKEAKNQKEFELIKELVKVSGSEINFQIILEYLEKQKNQDNNEEIDYWRSKLKTSY